jgi:DNA polymerase-3 subunit alpha (Gram-positive type)
LHDSLLKFDILGHDDPTALKMLEEITGVKPREIPFMDENVIKLFSSIESLKISSEDILGETVGTIGLPEFGTSFVRQILATAQPKSFADLIRIQGLSHGKDVWNNNAEQLISKINKTLKDVIACRDDIMIYLINKGVKPEVAFKTMEDARKGKGIEQYTEELKVAAVDQ